jgi:hypothetical protein
VWRYGVVGWGIPAALVTIAYKVVQEHGWVLSLPFFMSRRLQIAIGVSLIFFPALGHLFGVHLWEKGESKYREGREDGR